MDSAPALHPTRDQDLVLRHRYGDEQAFEEIFGEYRGMVFQLGVRLLGDPAAAEDATQDVFLRVYRHLDRFRGGSSLKTWIYRIAVNQCRTRLGRRRWAWFPLEDREGRARPIPDPAPGPEDRAAGRSERESLARALAALPPTFREAVVLRDVEELSYEEIASVLGVRIGTVRSRIARGRQRLRELVEGRP